MDLIISKCTKANHCFLCICSYLDTKDLLNVAKTCKFFRDAVQIIQKEKNHGQLTCPPYGKLCTDPNFHSTLRTLRCFGSSLNTLYINGFFYPENTSLVVAYLVKYCKVKGILLESCNTAYVKNEILNKMPRQSSNC